MFIYENLIQLIIQQINTSAPRFFGDLINGHAQVKSHFKRGFHGLIIFLNLYFEKGGTGLPNSLSWLRRWSFPLKIETKLLQTSSSVIEIKVAQFVYLVSKLQAMLCTLLYYLRLPKADC